MAKKRLYFENPVKLGKLSVIRYKIMKATPDRVLKLEGIEVHRRSFFLSSLVPPGTKHFENPVKLGKISVIR